MSNPHLWKRFWSWYIKTEAVQLAVAVVLFVLQVVHLVWLTGEVVALRLLGEPLFVFEGIHKLLIALVDYIEIPALITVNLVYINALRKREKPIRPIIALFLVNTQWLHLFWITDEVVLEYFEHGSSIITNPFLAWVAILIDYAELPVMGDLIRRLAQYIKRHIRKTKS